MKKYDTKEDGRMLTKGNYWHTCIYIHRS